MTWLGNCAILDKVYHLFSTQATSGEAVTPTVTTIAAYRDDDDSAAIATCTASDTSDNGLSYQLDFTGAGLNLVSIDTGDLSGVWTEGHDYNIVFDGTVDSVAVKRVLCTFSVSNRRAMVNVATISGGAISSATFAAGAITADKIAAGAITAATIADGAIDAATFAAGAINAAAVADDAIDAGALATGAITADAIAAGVVSGSTLAGEIEDAVFEAAVSDHTAGTGTVGYALNAIWGHTDKLGAGLITVHSPITAQGDLTITQGDSYLAGDITWTDSASTWPDLKPPAAPATLTIKFHTTNLTKTLVPSPVAAPGSPAVQPTTLTMPALAPTDTAALDVGFQSYWIEAVWDDDPAALPVADRRKTITRGVMYILAQRTA